MVKLHSAKLAGECVVLQVADPIELLKSNSTFQIRLLQQSLTLSRVSVGMAGSGRLVQPSDITEKDGGRDGGEGGVGGGRGREMLKRNDEICTGK